MSLDSLKEGRGDPEEWKKHFASLSLEDLNLHLPIWRDMQEYEVCAIIKKEIESRKNADL